MSRSDLERGFTFIELMTSVAIIGILAAISIPAYQQYTVRARIAEGVRMAIPIEEAISHYYDRWGTLPTDNAAAGLPSARSLRGAQVEQIDVRGGVIAIRYSDGKLIEENRNLLTIQPAVNAAEPRAALIWTCGDHEVPDGFNRISVPGLKTSIQNSYLAAACRRRT